MNRHNLPLARHAATDKSAIGWGNVKVILFAFIYRTISTEQTVFALTIEEKSS